MGGEKEKEELVKEKKTRLPISFFYLSGFCGTDDRTCYLGKGKSCISWMVTMVVGLSSDIKGSIFRMFIGERPRFSQFRFCCLCLECSQMHSDLWFVCVLMCVSFQRIFSCCGVVMFISVILSFRLDRLCAQLSEVQKSCPLHVVIRLCI